MESHDRNNYRTMEENNRRLFLTYEQEPFIRKFGLDADEHTIRFRMLRKPCEVDRRTGVVIQAGEPASINQTMTVYDMFCHSDRKPFLSGRWSSLQQLGGIIASHHVQNLSPSEELRLFAGHCDTLAAACESLGGTPAEHGDVSYILPVFDFFPVWLQFYDADDEFPASLSFLWDSNSLDFLHYETMWYLMGYIRDELRRFF